MTPFVKVRPEEVAQYGATGALVLAHIRYRCESDGPGRLVHDGHRWWRVSHGDLGREIGLTPRSVRTALHRLGAAVPAKQLPPMEDQTLAFRAVPEGDALSCQSSERSRSELPVVKTVAVPRQNGRDTASELTSALPVKTLETGGETARPNVTTADLESNRSQQSKPPSRHCPAHPGGTPEPCTECKQRRLDFRKWESEHTRQRAHNAERAHSARIACDLCDEAGWLLDVDGTPLDPARKCAHIA